MYISIPTYKNNEWSYTDFETKSEFIDFVKSQFLPPGEIKIKSKNWNLQAQHYNKYKFYCEAPYKSLDYINYWDKEKEKCRKGVIIDGFYLTRYYYFWINFLPINNKESNTYSFPNVFDSQYYFFIYIQRCELEYKYSAVVKKRQWGGSFQHLAILLCDVWFEQSYINKLGASDEKYILSDWQMLEEYRNFLNEHTAWYRNFSPAKVMDWEQKQEVKDGNRKTYRGNKSTLKGLNFKTNPTKGVGGKTNKFYYEEAGITKTMSKTFQYIDPALKMGAITTGMFMASGSVGELNECEDLKKMAYSPEAFNILPVKNIFEEESKLEDTCFFVPEYWSMPPYIDSNGNSIIDKPTKEEFEYLKSIGLSEEESLMGAKEWCLKEREDKKRKSSPEDYRMYISQHPFSISEAFAWRANSIFPQSLILNQQERLEAEKKHPSVVTLEYSGTTIKHKFCEECKAITKFPLGERDNKEGAIQIWEFPKENSPFLTYFAGVDPIATDKTTTSKSLFSIYIFKNLVEEKYTEDKKEKIKINGYKIVASYVGRHDDMKTTNEIAEKLIVFYNALTAVENNVPSFINHMQSRSLQRYLATKEQLSFISDLKTNVNSFSPYGFRMNETIKTYFIDIVTEYLTEQLDVSRSIEGELLSIVQGVTRIPDSVLLEELKLFNDKINVDRFVAFAAGLSLMKAFRKFGYGVSKLDNRDVKQKEQVTPIRLEDRTFFKHEQGYVVNPNTENRQQIKRTLFKHIR